MMSTIALLSIAPALIQGPFPLDQLVGAWTGAGSIGPLRTEAELVIRKEGAIYVMDLTRKELIQGQHERTYIEPAENGIRGISDPDYVQQPRRDRGRVTDRGITMQSEPWEIGMKSPMTLSWSLELGEYREAVKARIYIDTPTFHPNPNILTLTWSGTSKSGTATSQYQFHRKGSFLIPH